MVICVNTGIKKTEKQWEYIDLQYRFRQLPCQTLKYVEMFVSLTQLTFNLTKHRANHNDLSLKKERKSFDRVERRLSSEK